MTTEGSPLFHLLAARIAAEGPIPLSDYMAECLMHPAHGYYATRDPFGVAGDFTTAPEISQMFGEMLGICLAQTWVEQGRPAPFALAELGPGRGTLMADILRTVRVVPGMAGAARVHLVETSASLRERQRSALAAHKVTWAGTAGELPDQPLFLVANEFFDALPIRQFRRTGAGWSEIQIGLALGRLSLGLAPPAQVPALSHRLADTAEGDVVELCPPLASIALGLARRIAARGGAAIVTDYGGWRSRGDTLQAVRTHRPTDPLADPGEADLTAHVDFEALSLAFRAGGAAVTRMTPQGAFLKRLGIAERAQALASRLTGPALESHLAALRRLTDAAEMGDLFKAIACFPPGCPAPFGFDP
ncbi:MAG: class I SAM-dependent methyltransferase [Paracoccaceae bacterium]